MNEKMNTFSFGSERARPTAPEREAVANESPFADLSPQQITDLEVGPLNSAGFTGGINHEALKSLSEETIADMITYAQGLPKSTPELVEARRNLSNKITAAVQRANDEYWDKLDAA